MHNYAGCQVEMCEPCAHYEAGWVHGKQAAFTDLIIHHRANHAPGCGCQPCFTVNAIGQQAQRPPQERPVTGEEFVTARTYDTMHGDSLTVL